MMKLIKLLIVMNVIAVFITGMVNILAVGLHTKDFEWYLYPVIMGMISVVTIFGYYLGPIAQKYLDM